MVAGFYIGTVDKVDLFENSGGYVLPFQGSLLPVASIMTIGSEYQVFLPVEVFTRLFGLGSDTGGRVFLGLFDSGMS